jgi:tetratricopeptide (TPR) repeat protein
MPQVVNGCGTWYYGKKNLQQYQGVCRACGALTTLKSYDTRLYAVVLFVPLIPLARKRIIEQCPACTRHGAMPLDDWRQAEKRSAEAIAAYRASPNDAERAREALAACASFRNLPQFLDLAPDVERNLARDGETLRMLAAGYHLFGRAGDTERVLRTAMAAQDEDETREALVDCLLRQGRPFDAEPLLRHVVEQGIPDRVDWLYRLAQGFQMKGAHEKALEAFRQCEAVNPHITQDETFVRLRDESARNLGTAVPVQPRAVVTKAKRQASFRKFQRVAPVVLAMLLVAYAVVCFVQGRRREVYLVNALHKPYTVRLNGQPYTLQPRTATPVRVEEGELAVAMADVASPVAPE